MNLLPAIREDHDPFAVPALLPGPQRLLIFLRWTSYCCPHCKTVFHKDFWPSNVRLGCGKRTCRKCGRVFKDGSREWPELGRAQKFRFYLPPGIQAITGGLLFCAIFTLVIAPRDVLNIPAGVIVFLVFLSPTFVWCLVRLLWVQRSRHRFESEPHTMQRKMETQQIN